MTWSRMSVFNALESAGLGYAVRSTSAGLPYAGLRWRSAGADPLSFTLLEVDGAARLTAHAASSVQDAAGRMAATRRIPLGRFARNEDGAGSDLVVAFRSGEGLDGGHLLALFRYAEHVCLGGEPPLPVLGDTVPATLQPVPAPGSPPGVVVDGVDGWWRMRSPVTAPRGDVPWDLVDRLQIWAPVGRFLVSRAGALSFEALVPLLTDSAQDALVAGFADVAWCTRTAERHLSASPGG